MANQWGNPETYPPSTTTGYAVEVTCVVCGKKVNFGKTRCGERAPYFVCAHPCGQDLINKHGDKWPDILEQRFALNPPPGHPDYIDSKAETVRLLSGTPMPPDRSGEIRDKWLGEVFEFWICDSKS